MSKLRNYDSTSPILFINFIYLKFIKIIIINYLQKLYNKKRLIKAKFDIFHNL